MINNKTTYKDSPPGKIPGDWEVIKISDYGKVYTGNTPPTNDLENYGVEFVSVSVRLFNTALFNTSRTATQAHSKTLPLSN